MERHLPDKASRISTEDLHIRVEDDLLDLLAVLAFDRGTATESRLPVRWKVSPMRADFGVEPERIERDQEADRLVERFTIERLS
jgi:hypothetical protein